MTQDQELTPDPELTLYVSGRSDSSLRAMDNLPALCAAFVIDLDSVEVVDLAVDPQRAEDDRILATPTLVRWGLEQRRIVGDLADPKVVGYALGITVSKKDSP